jgi:hypothetical protein
MNNFELSSVNELPNYVKNIFISEAEYMLTEMRNNRLKFRLVELPYTTTWNGQKARAVENKNPMWYSDFYWNNTEHCVNKKGQNKRKERGPYRDMVVSSLESISSGDDYNLKSRMKREYCHKLRNLISDRLINGYSLGYQEEEDKYELMLGGEPNNIVRSYLGLDKIKSYEDDIMEGERIKEEFGLDYNPFLENMFSYANVLSGHYKFDKHVNGFKDISKILRLSDFFAYAERIRIANEVACLPF